MVFAAQCPQRSDTLRRWKQTDGRGWRYSCARERYHRSIDAAPRDGTLIRFWCRSEDDPVIGYWSKTFIGWVAYHEAIPLIRHDVTGWESIADQTAARAVPLATAPRRSGHRCGRGEGAAPSGRDTSPPGPQADARGGPLMAEDRPDAHDLPTPRSISRTGYRVHVWCKACRHAKDAGRRRQGRHTADPAALALGQLRLAPDGIRGGRLAHEAGHRLVTAGEGGSAHGASSRSVRRIIVLDG
jgi:hypothetical protein